MGVIYTKTIICLANSRKLSGRCIAGKEMDGSRVGAWVRPISARAEGEISEEERRFENGGDPRPLDIIRIPMLKALPHGCQVENHVIDEGYYWTHIRRGDWSDLSKALDEIAPLWSDVSCSSYNGQNDRIEEAQSVALGSSLRLISVDNLTIIVRIEGAEFGNGKRRVRGVFTFCGTRHQLSVTDPLIEREFLERSDGIYKVGQAVLCVSVGEPYQGYVYKLIAGVFRPPTSQ